MPETKADHVASGFGFYFHEHICPKTEIYATTDDAKFFYQAVFGFRGVFLIEFVFDKFLESTRFDDEFNELVVEHFKGDELIRDCEVGNV